MRHPHRRRDRRTKLAMLDLSTYFFKEIEVNTVSLLLSDKEVALFKASGDSSNVHWFRFSHCFIDNGARHGEIDQSKILVVVMPSSQPFILTRPSRGRRFHVLYRKTVTILLSLYYLLT